MAQTFLRRRVEKMMVFCSCNVQTSLGLLPSEARTKRAESDLSLAAREKQTDAFRLTNLTFCPCAKSPSLSPQNIFHLQHHRIIKVGKDL